ncbi:MAG: putative addiction module antidote protein [Candidatus Omnitrophica bacterium]|nr:putative addiction module antidote protein [Candidatus Omnitrophota bacterium]
MNKKKFRMFDEVQIEHYKKHPQELKSYIQVALEEYQKDGDEKAFLAALSVAARVHGGFSKLSRKTGLNRENLYRALSEHADPRLSTVVNVLNTLKFSLKIA